jgi:hypothetical protein
MSCLATHLEQLLLYGLRKCQPLHELGHVDVASAQRSRREKLALAQHARPIPAERLLHLVAPPRQDQRHVVVLQDSLHLYTVQACDESPNAKLYNLVLKQEHASQRASCQVAHTASVGANDETWFRLVRVPVIDKGS